MSEQIYRWLLALYPARFRQEYGEASLDLFRDRMRAETGFFARCRLWFDLMRDTAISVPGEYRRRQVQIVSGALNQASGGVPVFYSCEGDIPRGSALIHGAILSIAVFAAVTYIINHGGSDAALLVGSHHPSRSHLMPAETSAIPTAELNSEIKIKPYPDSHAISDYFRLILVLGALDADHDGIISSGEIAHAAAALSTLDKNRDSKLTAEECGLHIPESFRSNAQLVTRVRLDFMRFHPVLAALDGDHDGEISASEIRNAPTALTRLDRNGDGRITEDEVLPPRSDR